MLYNLYISAASCLRQERTNKAKQYNIYNIYNIISITWSEVGIQVKP